MADSLAPSLRRAGWLLGFALGGFFDGILLHQVLQWHHLLSDVEAVRDLRTQLLADGLFHALMYLLALAGLWLLWRARVAASAAGSGRQLAGHALLAFGAWHLVDALLSHWLTGIHRIRADAANPLLWDLGWLALFGLVPMGLGWLLRRTGAGPGTGSGGPAAAATLGLVVLLAGPLAALPRAGAAGQSVVLFAPGVAGRQAFDALAEVGARVLWVDRGGGLWVVQLADPQAGRKLLRRGGWLAGEAGAAFGCLGWTTAQLK